MDENDEIKISTLWTSHNDAKYSFFSVSFVSFVSFVSSTRARGCPTLRR